MQNSLYCSLYSKFFLKMKKELEWYRRGKGISILEEICLDEPQSELACLSHSRKVEKVLRRYKEKWVEKLLRKVQAWEKVFDSILSIQDVDIEDSIIELVDGDILVEEVVSYAR